MYKALVVAGPRTGPTSRAGRLLEARFVAVTASSVLRSTHWCFRRWQRGLWCACSCRRASCLRREHEEWCGRHDTQSLLSSKFWLAEGYSGSAQMSRSVLIFPRSFCVLEGFARSFLDESRRSFGTASKGTELFWFGAMTQEAASSLDLEARSLFAPS